MKFFSQDPTDDDFVQNPYGFYEIARASGEQLFFWEEYGIPCTVSYAANWAILRDRRFGREVPADRVEPHPAHQAGFWAVEDHSLLEKEPPGHTRLRRLILRAFTSRRINELAPDIERLAHELIDALPPKSSDVLAHFAQKLPIIIIARLLGVPESRTDDMLNWSHAMVGMYQAGLNRETELAAANAATEFAKFMKDYIRFRRDRPADDLITHLIAAEQDGERLSTAELISTCILLLNAGHEATVHSIGNGIYALLRHRQPAKYLTPDRIDGTVEEILRYDAPIHMFQRWAYSDIEIGRHTIKAGQKVACLLGGANRDPQRWGDADKFDPLRPVQTHTSFGAGTHFCIGAPLARLEMQLALPVLFDRLPDLSLNDTPRYAPKYHFHGLESLNLSY